MPLGATLLLRIACIKKKTAGEEVLPFKPPCGFTFEQLAKRCFLSNHPAVLLLHSVSCYV
jgi:hypothetical protein